jgi:WhiB family redox-sensing transcriptional regulator
MEPCRRHALAAGEPYGIWGGLSEAERSAAAVGRRSGIGVRDIVIR